MAKKFSQFSNGLTNQSPTDTLVGLDLSLPTSQQNTKWTLDSLFSTITRNIADKAVRFQAGSGPTVSLNNESALYSDGANLLLSTNGSPYAPIRTGGSDISGAVSGNLIRADSTTTGTDSGIVSTEAANSVNSRYNVANYATLAVAVAAIGSSTQATLVIASSISVTASLTVTGNITLEFTNAGALNISAAQVVTILGGINAPLRTIFTGSGSVTFTANRRITTFYPQWWGGIPDDSTDSTTAGNAAINAAISVNTTGGGEVFFSPGAWRGNFTITQARGIKIKGNSRFSTTLRAINGLPALTANGLWYSRIEGITFATTVRQVGHGVLEIDGNHDGINTLGVQGNTISQCTVAGQGTSDGLLSDYAFTMCRQGSSNGQGSENLYENVHLSGASIACYYQSGFNALNNTFLGGNMNGYSKHGIFIVAGSVEVFSVGFQSTFAYTQVVNDGYDIDASSAGVGEGICVYGCRTESLRFYRGGASQKGDIRALDYNPDFDNWIANTAYSLNQVLSKSTSGGLRIFRVTTAGTSGGSEPTWPASGTVADGSVVWTQTTVNCIDMIAGSVDYRTSTIGFGATVLASGTNFWQETEVQADYTTQQSDTALFVNTATGAWTITLSSPITDATRSGQYLVIRRGSNAANNVTVAGATGGSVILPGGTTDAAIFARLGGVFLGTAWYLVGYFSSQSGGIFQTKAGDPATSDIDAGRWALYKNTSSGVLSLWANDGGVMKSVALT